MNQLDPFEKIPLAVYDTSQKKCVMIFSSSKKAAMYIFGNTQKTNRISDLVKRKSVNKHNKFNKRLAFRKATEIQVELLGDKEFIILDNTFETNHLSKEYKKA